MRDRDDAARLYRRFRAAIDFFRRETALREFTPRGHYHSPLPDITQAAAFAAQAARRPATEGLPALPIDTSLQSSWLDRLAAAAPAFDWQAEAKSDRRFFLGQDWFNAADALALVAAIIAFQPRRIVEIGSGFSSALMLDARDKGLASPALTFIDPNPARLHRLLKPGDEAQATLVAKRVQDAEFEIFEALESGDVLFVDSSHVARAGSDLNHIVFEILPRLRAGVVVHFHDIFWPFEYPPAWIEAGTAWNEAYLLRAFLMFNSDFRIEFWPAAAASLFPRHEACSLAGFPLRSAQSIWLYRVK
jgi:predicted O-methyltransferase YrrM